MISMNIILSKFLRKAMIIFSIVFATTSVLVPIIVALNFKLPIEKAPVLIMMFNILMIIGFYYGIYICYKKKYILGKKISSIDIKTTLIAIIIFSFVIRLFWILIVPTKPASDFALMFEVGKNIGAGNYSAFKGNSYFARFSHDIITVLYFSLFYKISSTPLIFVKLTNILFQTLSIYAIYLLVKELYSEKKGIIAAGLLGVFPPFIIYTSEVMSENMAIPLYILSCYFLLKGIKKSFSNFIISGVLLSFASMFRKVGEVFLVAYIVFLLVYIMKEK